MPAIRNDGEKLIQPGVGCQMCDNSRRCHDGSLDVGGLQDAPVFASPAHAHREEHTCLWKNGKSRLLAGAYENDKVLSNSARHTDTGT